MCGIAGWLGNQLDGERHATKMARVLHHRGPDSYGIQSWPEATLNPKSTDP
jgi:asparagine synthetase B (glutamine-hydrolysing)